MKGPLQHDAERLLTVEEMAAEWFGLKRSGEMSDGEARAFETWLNQEPEHRAAYDNLEHYWLLATAVRNDPQVLAMRDAAARRYGGRRKWSLAAAAAAAMVMIAVIAGQWLGRPSSDAHLVELPAPMMRMESQDQVFRTAVGQTNTVLLPDGSTIMLDTDTVMRAILSDRERRMELDRGRAFFKVAKDRSRPFIVLAAGRTITATGTAFDVRADPRNFEVVLVEGRVRVESPRSPTADHPPQVAELTPGSQLLANQERWTVAEADLPKRTSWLHGRLTFDQEPLREVVAELNRYSERKIVLADEKVGEAPILGVFKAGDVKGFATALEEYRLARIVSETDDSITLATF